MIVYKSLEEQVDADFARARRKNALRRATARLRNGPTPEGLHSFEEFRKQLGAVGRVRLGRKLVRSNHIVGSFGRCSEFDKAYLPAKASDEAKWKKIDLAFRRGEKLPPVSLYEVGDAYFVLDGNHRVSVARYHGVEMIDAVVTKLRIPSLAEPTRAGTIERPEELMRPDEPSERGDSEMREVADAQHRIEVRWGLHEDETRIAELLELNGVPSRVAKNHFIVAERDGNIVAALRYETEPKKLVLGLLVADSCISEPILAKALYPRVHSLAEEVGVREVTAPSNQHGDYLREAGYRRVIGGWSLDTVRPLRACEDLPAGGWRRMVALLGVPAVPFFRTFGGAERR